MSEKSQKKGREDTVVRDFSTPLSEEGESESQEVSLRSRDGEVVYQGDTGAIEGDQHPFLGVPKREKKSCDFTVCSVEESAPPQSMELVLTANCLAGLKAVVGCIVTTPNKNGVIPDSELVIPSVKTF